MIERIDVNPDDRILLLSIPDISLVVKLAARCVNGLVTGLGSVEQVAEARRNTRALMNVMFTLGPPEEIPWGDGFFTKAVDLACQWHVPEQVARELARVLEPGGTVFLSDADATKPYLLAAGFVQASLDSGLLIARNGK